MPKFETDDLSWRELRKNHGGSSEAAALFDEGYADMPSRWSLWALKSGKLDETRDLDDDDRVWIGKNIEPIIAKLVTRKMGWDLHHMERTYFTHEDPTTKMGATCDYDIREHEDGPGILEIKNRDWLQWNDSYTEDDASIRDRIQLAHQFACRPEMKWGAVGVLVGGNELRIYTYTREDLAEIMESIEAGWRELWLAVADGDEPDLTGTEIPAWLKVHYIDFTAGAEPPLDIDDATFDINVTEYLAVDEGAKSAAKEAKTLKAKIVQTLDMHEAARSPRYRVRAKYTEVPGTTITLPDDIRVGLDAINAMSLKDLKAVEAALAWSQETRKSHVRLTLKFDDDPKRPPDADALAASAESQAPLD